MGLSQYYLVFALSILYFNANINAQTPKPCCTTKVFTTSLSVVVQTTGSAPYAGTQDGNYYYDEPNNRTAANLTVANLAGSISVQQVYQILDYGKHTQYAIVDDKVCYKTPLQGPFPSNGCIPDNAKFEGTVKFGETLAVNRWYIDVPQVKLSQRISTTIDKCVLVTSTILLESGGQQTCEAQDYYDFKEGIENPTKIFTPPKICDKASLLDANSKITDEIAYLRAAVMRKPFLLM